jgi:hypothetical protein
VAKVRAQLHGQQGFAHVDTEATKGATLGENLFRKDGSVVTEADLAPAAAAQSGLAVTLWRLVREIPANIKGLAAVTTNGWFRKDGTTIVAREIAGTDLPDLADSGTGSLLAITRDAKGRVSGSRAATAVDLAGLTLTAAVDISALRMIVAEGGNGRYPSLSTPSDAGRVVGMSVSAATTGNSFATITRGEWMDAGWAWVPGPIFCGATGALTQTPPAGWVLEVGRAVSATRALIEIKTPLKRA